MESTLLLSWKPWIHMRQCTSEEASHVCITAHSKWVVSLMILWPVCLMNMYSKSTSIEECFDRVQEDAHMQCGPIWLSCLKARQMHGANAWVVQRNRHFDQNVQRRSRECHLCLSSVRNVHLPHHDLQIGQADVQALSQSTEWSREPHHELNIHCK
jgi:hypothetical protein